MDNTMDNRNPLFSLESVSKGFYSKQSKIEILNQASFTIHKGETVAVVGSSGIGKSTLLNLIGTLDKPDSGNVLYQNEDLSVFSDEQLARFRNTKIGFVFQFNYLLKGL